MAKGSLVAVLALLGLLGSCAKPSGSGPSGSSDKKFTAANIEELLTDPSAHKGASIDIVGKVFGEAESDGDGVSWQMFGDPHKSRFDIVVLYSDPGFTVKRDDYVHVVGTVDGETKGKDAVGGPVIAAKVTASAAEVVNALAAAQAAIKTITPNAAKDQHGLVITLEKVEFAAEETRVFISVVNGTKNKASFFTFDTKAVQGSTQYESEAAPSNYPEVQSELLPGDKSSGVVIFAKMDPASALRLIFEAQDDSQMEFTPYEFEVGP